MSKNNTKIEITYRDLAGEPGSSPYDSINHLLDREDFPVMFSHRISKLASIVIPEIKHIDAMFTRLVKKHGHLTENSEKFTIDAGSQAEKDFSSEYEAFLNEKVRFDFEKINLLGIQDYKIKPRHLKNLQAFFKE